MSAPRPAVLFWSGLSAAVLASRLLHSHILWADEDYHLAAAIQVLAGKLPYRDFWYDKPPLNLLYYLLFGARTGVPLRVADAAFVMLCCGLIYRFASQLWSRREGYLAAAGLAFFSIFYLAPGVIPEEPDTLMVAPHLAAVYLAFRRRPFLAGLAAAFAFQLSVKGLLVLVSAALFTESISLPILLAGFVVPNAVVAGWLALAGAWSGYLDQVWKWGLLDAASPPIRVGVLSVFNWFGFHAALVAAAAWYWTRNRKTETVRTLVWCCVSFGGVALGLRFAPRYFMQLLPALLIPAARGFSEAPRAMRLLIVAALLVPAIRFGPRYFELAGWNDTAWRDTAWTDTAMDREDLAAAHLVLGMAKPNDSIFVWGYRPGVVAYSRLPVAGRMWDSQPLTGVPADRHLSDAQPVDEAWARQNRQELLSSSPEFIVDGLSLYNPRLDIHLYPDLAPWLARYCPAGRVGLTMVYRACVP